MKLSESKLIVKIKKIHPDAITPIYSSEGAVGLDFFSIEDYNLESGETYIFKTGIQMEIPEGYAGLFWDRSGLSSRSSIKKLAGVIDHDYRGEIGIVLHNLSKKDRPIKKGDKIAQMLIQKVEHVLIQEVEELSETSRGSGGFGSTDKK
jgi:dUTP pyrophosphatase